jgi:8-oxo-dGTP pyrophosphatase MutT (NUDIX family)
VIQKYTLFLLLVVIYLQAMESENQMPIIPSDKLKPAAGILPYAQNPSDEQYYFLLGQEIIGGGWCDFGGGREEKEANRDAAIREFKEESGYFDVVPKDKDSVDLFRQRLKAAPYLESDNYIMYVVQIAYLLENQFKDHQNPVEKAAYRWIGVKDFIKAIDARVYDTNFEGINQTMILGTVCKDFSIIDMKGQKEGYKFRPEFLISLRGLLKCYDPEKDKEYFASNVSIPCLIEWLKTGENPDPQLWAEGHGQLPQVSAGSVFDSQNDKNGQSNPGERRKLLPSGQQESSGWGSWIWDMLNWLWSCLPSLS